MVGRSPHAASIAAERNGFLERPRAVGIDRDAGAGKTIRERRDRFHFLRALEHAALQFEIVESVPRLGRFRETDNRIGRQRGFVAQPQPVIGRVRSAAIRQVRLGAIAEIEQVAEHFDGIALPAFAEQRGNRQAQELSEQIEQRGFNRRDGVNRGA